MDLVLPLDSSSNDTSGVNRVIRRDFEYVAEVQRSMAVREGVNRKPKRFLTAYNLFFKSERAKLVKAKRKLGFSDMAKEISAKWNALDSNNRKQFDEEAVNEKRRYKVALSQWKAQGKLDLKKLIANQQQHITTSGDCILTPLPSLVSQNEPDPSLIRRLSLQQRAVDQQLMMQVQLQNTALFAGPHRMSMPTFTSSLVGGSEESDSSHSLPMSLHGNIGRHREMATCHQHGLSWYSIPPLGAGPRCMSMPTFISSPPVEESMESHKSASLPMSFQGSAGRQGEVTTRHHQPSLPSVPPLLVGPRPMSMHAFTSSPSAQGAEECHKSASLPISVQARVRRRREVTTRQHELSLSSVPPLLAGPRHMPVPAFTSSPPVQGAEEWHKSASLPMSVQAHVGRRREVTTRQHDVSLSSVPPLLAEPRHMPISAFTSSPPVKESEKGAPLPKSLQVSTGCRFSLPEITTCHNGQSLSSLPLSSSFGAESSVPANFLENAMVL